jgi:hypothetical protein
VRYGLGYASLAALGIVIFRHAVAGGYCYHNALPLYPVALAILLPVVQAQAARLSLNRLVASLALVSVLAVSLGGARHALLFPYYLKSGMTLAEARRRFHEWEGPAPGRIGVTQSLWILTEDYGSVIGLPTPLPNVWRIRLIALQQYHTPQITEVDGYRLVQSYRTQEVPTLLGLPLSRSMPGYQFSIHAPADAPQAGP